MDLDNSIKKKRLFVPVICVISFVRSLVFAFQEMVGYDFYKQEKLFDMSSALFYVFSFLYSLMIAMFVYSVYKKYSDKCWLPCLLLLIDPVFFIDHKCMAILLIRAVWFLYLNLLVLEKKREKNAFQIFFLVISSVISPEVTLGYIPMLVMIEMISAIDDKRKTNKTDIIFWIVSITITVIGIIVNRVLCSNNFQFKEIVDSLNALSYYENDRIKSVLVLSAPSLFVGLYFMFVIFQKYKQSRKGDKKSINKKKRNEKEVIMNVIMVSFVLLFVGYIFGGYRTLSTISMIAPLSILLLAFTGKKEIDCSLSHIDGLILCHPVATATIFMFTFYGCIRFFLEEFGETSVVSTFFVWGG